jgi:Fe-S-cluster containining protein
MEFDAQGFFRTYENLANKADHAFSRIKETYPEEVVCKPGCTDCCFALFDLTLIEAMYLNHRFNLHFSDEARQSLLEKANRADRQIYKRKKQAYQKAQKGEDETRVVEDMAKERIRCPLLNESDRCDLYAFRPIACRIYGAPLSIGGKGRTCGLTGFEAGRSYTTINMDALHDQLLKLSAEMVKAMGSRHVQMDEVLVPLSMALLTDYNEQYLGIGTQCASDQE